MATQDQIDQLSEPILKKRQVLERLTSAESAGSANAADIATNTADIATNTAAIAAIAAPAAGRAEFLAPGTDTLTVTIPDQGTTNYSPIITPESASDGVGGQPMPAGNWEVAVVNATSFTISFRKASDQTLVTFADSIFHWVVVKH